MHVLYINDYYAIIKNIFYSTRNIAIKIQGNISLFICLHKQATRHTKSTFLTASRPWIYFSLYLEHNAFPH